MLYNVRRAGINEGASSPHPDSERLGQAWLWDVLGLDMRWGSPPPVSYSF